MFAGAGIAYQDLPEYSRKLSAGTENAFHYCITTTKNVGLWNYHCSSQLCYRKLSVMELSLPPTPGGAGGEAKASR